MKTFLMALIPASVVLTGACLQSAQAEPIVSAQCSSVGDVAAQIAGWRDHHKTKAQAVAQIAKYYSDPTDRKVLDQVVAKIYSDPAPKLSSERVSMEITSDCVNGDFSRAAGAAD